MGLKSNLYTKRNLSIVRIISLITIIILSCAVSKVILLGENFNNSKEIIGNSIGTILVDIICIICACILVIWPEKFIIISIVSFMYSIIIFIDEPNNQMGILMCLLCYFTLYLRNFFYSHKRIKIIILGLIFFCSWLSEIRFGFSVFLGSFFYTISFLSVICIILFFFKEHIIIETKNQSSIKILNLFTYIGTRKEDVQLLQLVLEKKQYLEISQIVFRTEGTVRNRLNKLYDILGVADRIGFVTTYVGYEIVYDETIETENCKLSSIKKVNLNTKT